MGLALSFGQDLSVGDFDVFRIADLVGSQRRDILRVSVLKGGFQSGEPCLSGHHVEVADGLQTGDRDLLWVEQMCVVVVGPGAVHLRPVLVPLPAGTGAGLGIAVEVRCHGTAVDIFVDVEIAGSAGERHGDVVVVVHEGFEGRAPLRCGAGGPGAPVRLDVFSVLIIVSGAFLLRAPVHLRDNNRIGHHHGHSLSEGLYVFLRIVVIVISTVPSYVVVHGISDVLTLDGMGSIAAVVGLPTGSRHPDDARESVGAYLVDDGLEEVVHRLGRFLALGVVEFDGLVGEFYRDGTGVGFDDGILANHIPDVEQIFLIVISYLDLTRTYARRPHDDIHAVVHGLLHQGDVEVVEEVVEAVFAES